MNKKGLTWSTIAGIVLMVVIVTILLIGINRGIAIPLFKLNSCPLQDERCLPSCENTGLTQKTVESTTKNCKEKGMVCCMTVEEISGSTKVKSLKDGSSGTGGSGSDGTGTAGTPGDVDIRIEKSDDQLVRFSSGQTITLKQGDVLKIDTWIESGKNKEKYCSVNLRDVTNGVETGFIIEPVPAWFTGTITRQECLSLANKKYIEVKYDPSAVGKKFKIDIMAAATTDINQRFTGSATLFIVMAPPQQGTTNTNQGTGSVTLNGQQVISPLTRKSNNPVDEFKVMPPSDAKYCKVELTDNNGNAVSSNVCIMNPLLDIGDCTTNSNYFKIFYDKKTQGQESSCTGRLEYDGSYINNLVPEQLTAKVKFYKDKEGTQNAGETTFTINVETLRGDQQIHIFLNSQSFSLGGTINRICGESGRDEFVIWEEQINSKRCSYIRAEENTDTNLASEIIISGTFTSPKLCNVENKKTIVLDYISQSCNNALNNKETGNIELKTSLDSGSPVTLAKVVVNKG